MFMRRKFIPSYGLLDLKGRREDGKARGWPAKPHKISIHRLKRNAGIMLIFNPLACYVHSPARNVCII